jgi:ATP-binding protein involved in chromosome partitioning
MFRQVGVPILGIVENMSVFVCPHGDRIHLFGEGGGARIAAESTLPLLGELPFDLATQRGGDSGHPVVVAAPSSAQAEAFRDLAGHVAARISVLALRPLPTIE